jgi:RNA polymerase sigma-70 factor, ECF subfamily
MTEKRRPGVTAYPISASEGLHGKAKAVVDQAASGRPAGTTFDDVLPLVYKDLRRLAGSFLRRERRGHTLQPTELVHEACVRLMAQRDMHGANRAQVFALAAQMMRRILVNHAEARRAAKRGGGALKITLDPSHAVAEDPNIDVLVVNDALTWHASFAPQQADIVELRFFGGLTTEEIAELLGKSARTIEREWRAARAWLYGALREPQA